MNLEWQILIAVSLDFLIGDPRSFPHPVKLMGRLALSLELPVRRMIGSPRVAGILTALTVVCVVAVCSAALVFLFRSFHPLAGDVVSILLIYASLAARDMVRHSIEVYNAIKSGSIRDARKRVAWICGRDVDRLEEKDVVRATVESVAENMVDGVISPLFYAMLGGPVVAMAYKAISTLDSTFGYKNDRYLEFGWASAKIDDVANFIPARIAGILVPVAAFVLRMRPVDSWRAFIRDRHKHPSPNSAQAEAAVAGALGIQLGGLSYYSGKPSQKQNLGDPVIDPDSEHILMANRLLWVTFGLCLVLFLAGRLLVKEWAGL
jgi:adenosylcobinamide-phosphate synthase